MADCIGILVGNRAIERRIRADFVIILFEFAGEFAEIGIIFIKFVTISDDFTDVRVELRRSSIRPLL